MSIAGGVAAPSANAVGPTATRASSIVLPEWLSVLNTYRSMSGLPAVSPNSTWSEGDRNHACYMTMNGMGHDEVSWMPGYTASGDTAAALSNVAVNTATGLTARYWLELWLTGPFHAIGLLRHNLVSAGYGDCVNPSAPVWHSAAALNVISGLGSVTRPSTPIVFPGNGTTTSLDRFVAETPSPVEMCGWSGPAGLPLIAMMPETPSGTITATLTGPSGPLQVCRLSAGNTPAGFAQDTLRGDNAVVVVPRDPLSPGLHVATVRTGTRTVTWSFVVDPSAPPVTTPPSASPIGSPTAFTPLAPTRVLDTRQVGGGGRLTAGSVRPVQIAGQAGVATGSTGVTVNLTVVRPAAGGYVTAYPCTDTVPTVSTVNFAAGQTIANLATVSLSATGALCVHSTAATDVLIDVAGANGVHGTHGLQPVTPTRVFNSRDGAGERLVPDAEYALDLRSWVDGGDAVEVSMVAIGATAPGYLTLWPCGELRPTVSNVNYEAATVRSNHATVIVGRDAELCLASSAPVHVVVDLHAVMTLAATGRFTATTPFRLVDTRSMQFEALQAGFGGSPATGGATVQLAVAGTRGIPADARGVVVNITVAGARGNGWVTAWPCGSISAVSTMNYDALSARASATVLSLSAGGTTCLLTSQTAHLIVDVVGWWTS